MAGVQHPTVTELAQQLSEGFAALTDQYQLLFDQHRQLESKLSFAKQQCLDLFKQYAPDALSQNHLTFLQSLEGIGADPNSPDVDWKDQLSHDEDPERRRRASRIKQADSAAIHLRVQSVNDQVKIWAGPSADRDRIQKSTELPHIERDFTTPGTPSKLGCPFASGSGRHSALVTPRSSTSRMSLRGPRSKRPSFNDPIRAEICANEPLSASGSVDGSAAACPIRFLDQHKPEEVAQYFENHKHEIPRSHEVCIKRFQSNADSIRQLDAKYGSLVSMIQGLGLKHQPWLPKEPEEVEDELFHEGESDEKVEKWAKAVSASLQDSQPEEEPVSPRHVLDETRTAHFDRPLKEIRLGESPTRPWGISVPSKYAKADTASVESAPTASPPIAFKTSTSGVELPHKPSKCPFNHGMSKAAAQPLSVSEEGRAEKLPPQRSEKEASDAKPASRPEQSGSAQHLPISSPQMIFNGPVFIGYPLDQALSLLQQSNGGRTVQ